MITKINVMVSMLSSSSVRPLPLISVFALVTSGAGLVFCLSELNNLVLEAEAFPGIDELVHSVDCVMLIPEPVVQAGILEFLGASAVLIHALDINLITSFHFNFPFRPLACLLFPCCDYNIPRFRWFVNNYFAKILKKL